MGCWDLPEDGEWVVKPTVGLASLDTGRYQLTDAGRRCLAAAHLARRHQAGRTAMVQRYLAGVDSDGETALVSIDGVLSHVMRNGAVLDGPDTGVDPPTLSGGRRYRPTPDWVVNRLPRPTGWPRAARWRPLSAGRAPSVRAVAR